MDNLRDISLTIYMEVMEKNKYLHIEMNRALEKYDYLDRQEKAFIRRLVTGSVETAISLDACINAFSKVKVRKMKPLIRSLLRLSVYQIMYMDSVADAVAVDEAVKLAKQHHFAALSGFVNAVLRNILRNKNTIVLTNFEKLNIPENIYNLLRDQYGDRAEEICKSYLEHENKGLIIRVNRSKTASEAELMDLVGGELISEELGCYRLKASGNISDAEGFSEGKYIVQDTAACLPVFLSKAKAGDRVLELCAAPGGKSIQLADQMKGQGYLECRDISPARCQMIEEALERCAMSAKVVTADARISNETDREAFDVCLVDAPCSGLGVIGSKPDIRYHFQEESLAELRGLQKEIIEAAVKTVKKGGLLVYSTCTLDKRENDEILSYALGLRPSKLIDLSSALPECFSNIEIGNGITIFPAKGLCEGFYVGAIRME